MHSNNISGYGQMEQRDAGACGGYSLPNICDPSPTAPRDENGIHARIDRLTRLADHLHGVITELSQRISPFTRPLPATAEAKTAVTAAPNSSMSASLHELEHSLIAAMRRLDDMRAAVDH